MLDILSLPWTQNNRDPKQSQILLSDFLLSRHSASAGHATLSAAPSAQDCARHGLGTAALAETPLVVALRAIRI